MLMGSCTLGHPDSRWKGRLLWPHLCGMDPALQPPVPQRLVGLMQAQAGSFYHRFAITLDCLLLCQVKKCRVLFWTLDRSWVKCG